MNWLARLKNGKAHESEATKTTETLFVVSVALTVAPFPKKEDATDSLPGDVPDSHCWPHSTAMNGAEIDLFTARLHRFTDKGLTRTDGEAMADKLVLRDRDQDDQRICLECRHIAGHGAGSWRCGNWQAAGVAIRSRDAQLPADLVVQLQRCHGFTNATPQTTVTP